MSPILDIQYRLRELGRIRMGNKSAKGAPQKLDTWRLTSASRELLESAAERYGGTVQVWEGAPNEGEHYELITGSDTLEVVIPPNESAFSQWMELWSGGGCQKRCDGQRQVLVDKLCSCPKDPEERKELAKQGKACKETTRFNVLLPDIPDVGVWRLETHGYYAAVELAAFQQLAALATSQGQMIRAKLRIDFRTSKKVVNGKSQTHRYTVPVVQVPHTVADVLQALGADVSDLSIALPAPVEGRNLPSERPALPSQAPRWDIEDEADETTAVEAVDPLAGDGWVDHLVASYGTRVLDVINDTRSERGLEQLLDPKQAVKAPIEMRRAWADKLKELAAAAAAEDWGEQGSEGSASTDPISEPTAEQAMADDAAAPATPSSAEGASTGDGEDPHSRDATPSAQISEGEGPPASPAEAVTTQSPSEGESQGGDAPVPTSSAPDVPALDRSDLMAKIDAAVTAKLRVGRSNLTEGRVTSIASGERMKMDPASKPFVDYEDFYEHADAELLAALVGIWRLDELLEGVA